MNNPESIDAYIASFPKETQKALEEVRQTIRSVVPQETEESIKYGIPTFVLQKKNVVHYGGYASHVGFYPSPAGIVQFQRELSPYKTSKGAVQFPIDQPMPLDIIRQISLYRIQEILKAIAPK